MPSIKSKKLLTMSTISLVLWPLASLAGSAEGFADLVFRSGKIETMIEGQSPAAAVAIVDQRITAIGSNQDVDPLIGPETEVIELNGELVIPGLIEGHGHFLSLGQSKMILDLSDANSWEEITDQVADAAGQAPPGHWIVGRGWHQGKWAQPPEPTFEGYPTHNALSLRTPNHPVILTHRTGHMLFANARAMLLAGVDGSTGDPPGGEILRDENGNPTGAFRENAMSLIRQTHYQSQQRRTADEFRNETLMAVKLATEECWAHGITSFQDAGASLHDVELFRELAADGQLGVRLWVMLDQSNEILAGQLAGQRVIGFGDHYLTVRAIKRMVDGALGTHGAWLIEPYHDLTGSTGHNTTSLTSLKRTADLARQFDFQLCIHAIGDRANHEVLNLFEAALPSAKHDKRWRIEHAQHIAPSDIGRFGKLGVIASMQGVHCTSDAPFVVQRLGERRAKIGAYVWRSLLDSGAVVINGSDAPVEKIDAIACFYSSVTRRVENGVAFYPEQRMTRKEALRSYTRDAAFAAFEETSKGTLARGYLADLVVLDKDILSIPADEIRSTRVLFTVVGGQIRYRAGNADPVR